MVSAARRVHTARRLTRSILVTTSGRRLGDAAAESAFFLALAILPKLLTTTAVLRAMGPLLGRQTGPGVERGLTRLLRIVLTSRGATAADAAQRLLDSASGGLLTLGSVAALILVARAMRSILTGLAEVGAEHGRGPVRARFVHEWSVAAWMAVVGVVLAAVILAMVAVGPLLGHTGDIASGLDSVVRVVWVALRWPVGIALVYLFLLLVHSVGLRGCGSRARRPALVGAAVTAVGVVGVSALLPVYVHVIGSVSPTVGALGGGLILLLWCYLLTFAILIGAQVRMLIIRAAGRWSAP